MASKSTRRLPTAAELRVLRVLWEAGPSSVRDVFDVLGEEMEWGYTTVLKVLQTMHAKRLVIRDETSRTHVYAAAVPPEQTQRALVSDLAERAFGGSAADLVLQALAARPASSSELAKIRKIIDDLQHRRK